MAAIEVNAIVLDHLQKAYTENFGRSPGLLVKALNDSFPKELAWLRNSKNASSQRDLISDKTLRNFFSATLPVALQEQSLNYLCQLLLGYSSYREAETQLQKGDRSSGDVSTTVPTLNKEDWLPAYQNHVEELCGTIRTLDMNQPVPLTGIYADVLINEEPRRQRQRTISGLLGQLDANPDIRNLGDSSLFGDSDKERERVGGLQAVQQYNRLVILGSPGAGKTTFCKYLAMHYLFNEQGEDLVPVYISLKDFSESEERPSLSMKVIAEFQSSVSEPKAIVQAWLKQGKCLLLFDGLDEVVGSDEDRIFRSIRDFIRHYPNNRFIITCRTAAQDKTNFENFRVVELADFNDAQIKQFVTRWFRRKQSNKEISETNIEKYIQRFLTKLEESKAVKELATNPLFLTMLCYLFEDSYSFPRNKHSLYGDAVDALLRRWDATRRIERHESYSEKLSRPRKINLFSKIAYEAFNQTPRKRLWQEWELEEQVLSFIENITGFKDLEIDSKEILKEIELNHGVIAEFFKGYFGFSHLTFQEYFTARYILDDPDSLSLIKNAIDEHLTDPGWKEVFIIIAGRLPSLDQMLKRMFEHLIQLMRPEGLQKMLHWLSETTSNCNVPSSAWRAFFLAIDLDTALYIERDTPVSRDRASRFATVLHEYNQQQRDVVKRAPRASLTLGLVAIHALATLSSKEPNDFVIEHIGVKGDIEDKLTNAVELAHELDLIDLEEAIENLKSQRPSVELPNPEWETWAENLRQDMMQHLNVGYEEPLTAEENRALDEYLYVGNLIMECIQGDGVVSKDLRENY